MACVQVIKGDARSYAVAAASILAKVVRGDHVADLHRPYPTYRLDSSGGYGTPEHRRLLAELGPTAAHRRTFNPLR